MVTSGSVPRNDGGCRGAAHAPPPICVALATGAVVAGPRLKESRTPVEMWAVRSLHGREFLVVPIKEGSMNVYGRQILAAVAILTVGGFTPGCKDDDPTGANHQIWFMGSIYDGATGGVLVDYDISLVYGTTTVTGKVDRATGRYTLGPLPAWNDYGVVISQGGYRAFTSYNSMIAPPTPPPASQQSDVYTARTMQTFDFDAYLFPDSLQSSALTVNITKTDPAAAAASGSIRLRPTTASVIQDQASGVMGQFWTNDQDMLANVINLDFTDGTITLDAGTLVYGVTYQVTVYGVEGFTPVTNQSVKAGFQDSLTINISTSAAPLMIVSNTISMCRPAGQSTNVVAAAQVSFKFNTSSVEDVTPATSGRGAEVLDANLSVVTTLGGFLKSNLSTNAQERATSFMLNGDTLSFSWNPSMGLMNPSASDSIVSVTYGGLSGITLQPTGHPEYAKTLSALLSNQTSIYCAN
jgi:hypothetical protein